MKNTTDPSTNPDTSAGTHSSSVTGATPDTGQSSAPPAHIMLARSVKGALVADPTLEHKRIAVEVFEDTAQLTGRVATRTEAGRASELAIQVAGVESVRDCIGVDPDIRRGA